MSDADLSPLAGLVGIALAGGDVSPGKLRQIAAHIRAQASMSGLRSLELMSQSLAAMADEMEDAGPGQTVIPLPREPANDPPDAV